MRKVIFLSAVLIFSFSLKGYALESVDIFSGFLEADLAEKDDYQVIPLFIGLNFDAEPFFEKFGMELPWESNFIFEPFVNTVISPDKNIEVGFNLLAKFTFPVSEKIQPYFKGGVGALYMSQHTNEQRTQYNFLPQAGGGVQYFLSEKVALGFEYRYRHLSNASTGSPNRGIDANLFLCGLSFFLN